MNRRRERPVVYGSTTILADGRSVHAEFLADGTEVSCSDPVLDREAAVAILCLANRWPVLGAAEIERVLGPLPTAPADRRAA